MNILGDQTKSTQLFQSRALKHDLRSLMNPLAVEGGEGVEARPAPAAVGGIVEVSAI